MEPVLSPEPESELDLTSQDSLGEAGQREVRYNTTSGTSLITFRRQTATGSQIVTFNPVTNVTTALTNGTNVDNDPKFSWDGQKVVFSRSVGSNSSSIMVVDANGSNLTTLIPSTANRILYAPSFSPDGRKITYLLLNYSASTGYSAAQIWVYDINQKRQTRIYDSTGAATPRNPQFLRSHSIGFVGQYSSHNLIAKL